MTNQLPTRSSPEPTRRRSLIRLAVATVGMLLLMACSPESPSVSSTGTTAPDSAMQTPTPSATQVSAEVHVVSAPGYPIGLTVVDGEPWAALARGRAVRAGDGSAVEVGRTPLRLLATPAGVWVSVFGEGTVALVDPVGLRVVQTVAGFGEPEGLAWAEDTLWVVDQAAGTLVGVRTDGSLAAPVPVGRGPRLASSGPSGVAVTSYVDGTVTLVDPVSLSARTSTRVCGGPQGVLEHDGVIWVACSLDGTLAALDPIPLAVQAILPDLATVDALAPGGQGVLVAVLAEGPTAVSVDTESLRVTARVPLSDAWPVRDGNVDTVVADGVLWVSSPVRDELLSVQLSEITDR